MLNPVKHKVVCVVVEAASYMATERQKEQMIKEELTEMERKMRFSLLLGGPPRRLLACLLVVSAA
jgi:hypothetical protein